MPLCELITIEEDNNVKWIREIDLDDLPLSVVVSIIIKSSRFNVKFKFAFSASEIYVFYLYSIIFIVKFKQFWRELVFNLTSV
jgi:hypothetical protein